MGNCNDKIKGIFLQECEKVDFARTVQGQWKLAGPIKFLLDELHKDLLDKSSKSRAVKRGHLLINKEVLLGIFEKWEKEYHSLDLAINGQSIETLRYAQAHEHAVKEWESIIGKVLDADTPIGAMNAVRKLQHKVSQQERHIARLQSTLLKTLKDLES